MTDFLEHQPVRTLRRVGEIAPGERGVVVHAYAIGDAYEVEFPEGWVEFVDGADLAPA